MRRLEMVAVDLLEFAVVDAVGGVVRLGPGNEPLMEVGALALEQPVVGRVAHQEVLKTVGVVALAILALGCTSCLPVSVPRLVGTRGANSGGTRSATAGTAKFWPITEALWTTSRSSASSRSRPAASSASIVGGTLSAATSPTCTHPVAVTAKSPIVNEHREQLLHEERVSGRGLQDLARDTGTQAGAPEQAFDDPARVRVAKRPQHEPDGLVVLAPLGHSAR